MYLYLYLVPRIETRELHDNVLFFFLPVINH